MVATIAPENTTPRAFPVSAAAKQLSLSTSNVWALIAKGHIRVVRIGRRTLVTDREIARLLEAA